MNKRESLDTLCAALARAIGVDRPKYASSPSALLCDYLDSQLNGGYVDRIFMYNPDAIGQWIYEKYAQLLSEVKECTDIEVDFATVMPSVTPVCFATMYTGAQPSVHGIQSYVKPVITIDTLFDALIRCGKKPAIVSTSNDSMSKIFLGRDMDYYIFDSIYEVNQKASELILEDKYDVIAVYNGNYDTAMHKYGPESEEALAELADNARSFCMFDALIEKHWGVHNTLIGFSMDHGCHEIDGGCGSHGLDMEEDVNIVHLYKVRKSNIEN